MNTEFQRNDPGKMYVSRFIPRTLIPIKPDLALAQRAKPIITVFFNQTVGLVGPY